MLEFDVQPAYFVESFALYIYKQRAAERGECVSAVRVGRRKAETVAGEPNPSAVFVLIIPSALSHSPRLSCTTKNGRSRTLSWSVF